MHIHFGGQTAQDHPATGVLLTPGVMVVDDQRGKELLKIAAAAGFANFPVRKATEKEAKAHDAAAAAAAIPEDEDLEEAAEAKEAVPAPPPAVPASKPDKAEKPEKTAAAGGSKG